MYATVDISHLVGEALERKRKVLARPKKGSLDHLIRGRPFSHLRVEDFFTEPLPQRDSVPPEYRIPSTTPIKGLYLSSYHVGQDLKWLRDHQVNFILDVGSGITPSFPKAVCYLRFTLPDLPTTHLCKTFSECHAFLDNALRSGKGVLVHCYAGMSRSATIVLSYLMRKRALSYQEAYLELKRHRPVIEPNQGFKRQLQAYEIHLRKERQQVKKKKISS